MPSCVVKECKNNSEINNKSDGITFHVFPSDKEIKSKWVAAIRVCRNEPQWTPSKSSVVCSDHFVSDDLYITQRGFRRVTRTGYPRKNLPESPNVAGEDTIVPRTSASDLMCLVTVEITSNADSELPESPNIGDKRTTLSNASTTSNFVSPTVMTQKIEDHKSDNDQISKYEMSIKLRRQSNIIKHSKRKIKTLQEKIRRLQKRNKSLKDVIHNLKKEKLM